MRPQARAPGEFRYWENLRAPWARALRAGGRLVLGFDPAPPESVVQDCAAMYYDADPLAEAFVDEVYLQRGQDAGRAMLDAAIAGGARAVSDAPDSLLRLFADLDEDPPWVDRAKVEEGAAVFRRWGTDVFRYAGAITLAGYAESSVAKPLILTGAYAGDSTQRRFLETAAFWIAVSEPGGLNPGAPGRASALRVRIMHVFVRRRLLAHPEWDLDAWGVPISQADAVLTLMGGSFGPSLGLRAMGYRTSEREVEAAMHFWRYVGHLMGVRPRWYPGTVREAWQFAFLTVVKAAHASGEDGRALCRAYAQAFAPDPEAPFVARMRAAFEHRLHLGYTRFFLPPWIYRRNGLPPAGPWALQPLVQAPFVFAAETLRRYVRPLDRVADRVARARRARWFARHMGDRPAEYRAVEAFTR